MHGGKMSRSMPPLPDFDQAPFLAIWETTQACDLVCEHCRASAQPDPLPGELTTEEGKGLLTQIREMGCLIVVLSGGDPLKRSDLALLVKHGKDLGLRVATIPAASDLLTREALVPLKEAGLDQIAFSLDAPLASLHDSFRGTPGAFAKTLSGLGWAKELGLPTQINTTVTARTLPYLREMSDFVSAQGVVFWEVFFQVPVGRGKELEALSAQQCEEAFALLYEVHRDCSFVLKVTEAPHYRRFVAQQENARNQMPDRLKVTEGPGKTIGLAPQAVNAGRGFLFVSYDGEIFPSGFLAVSAGNVRKDRLAEVYRESELFKKLRNPSQLRGPCGRCEYREICGGSRSRAFAVSGDYLASDFTCAYISVIESRKPIQTSAV